MSIHPRNERDMDRLLICHPNGPRTTLKLEEEEGELILCDEEEAAEPSHRGKLTA
jgi:hypothetical protein